MTATRARVRTRDIAVVTYLFLVVMLGTTLPTPLYAFYSRELDLSPLLVSVVFAVYAVAVLGTLVLLGRLSDHVGRRPVVLLAVAASAVSSGVFLLVDVHPSLWLLFLGRLVSGVSAGLATGAATAYLTELGRERPHPGRAAVLATVANTGGLALGSPLAGVLADHVAGPTATPFWVDLLLLVPALLLVPLRVPETVSDRDGWRTGLTPQRIGVPSDIRVPFLAAALAALASFSLTGFGTSLSGQLLLEGLHDHSHETVGVVAFLLLAAAVAAQTVAGLLPSRRANLLGLAVLPLGLVLLVASVLAASLPLLVIAVLVGGAGVGFSFRASLARVTVIAPPERRGEVISTYFFAAYVGLTIPVVLTGTLVTLTSLVTAVVSLAVFIAVLSVVAAAIVVRERS